MNKDKQIEDMVKICHFHNDGICHLCEELLVSCDRKCDLAILVENFYTAGYRKASEVAREIFEEIEEGIKAAVSALQFENNPIHRRVKHETYSILMRFVKCIEEKYTEEHE